MRGSETRPVRSAAGRETSSGRSSAELFGWAAVAGLALWPGLRSLDAGWIAEDAAILGHVERHGALGDWLGPQYGLALVRFWRPLVSTAWWLEERAFGIGPTSLRLLNVLAHLAAALLAGAVARRASGSPRAGLIAGACVATFPEVGGTVTWLAGRTDGLCVALMLGAAWAALRGRAGAAALAAFLACATKEFGFLLALWVPALLWARGTEPRAFRALAGAVALAVLAAFVWRGLALGGIGGGYLLATRDPGALARELPQAALRLAVALGPLLPALAVLALLGAAGRSLDPRLFVAGLLAGVSALVLLVPLARASPLEEQNRRLLLAAEAGFALAAGAAFARPSRRPLLLGAELALALLFLGWRCGEASVDAGEWRAAAAQAELEVAHARAAVRGAPASERPVLASFSRAFEGAYCLGWGAADRFRAPFEQAPRPVWPWRTIFPATAERPMAVDARSDGTLWPCDDPPRAPRLAVVDGAGRPLERLALDESAFQSAVDGSPRLVVAGAEGAAALEVVAYTELGYEPALLGPPGSGATSLMRILSCSNGVASIGDALRQAADVGATRGFLELRALGAQGELHAASPWIEIAWDPSLRERVRP